MSTAAANPTQPHTPTAPPRRLSAPPARPGRLAAWLLLLLVLVLAAPTLLVRLDRPDLIDPLEARALATSIQTDDHLTRQTPDTPAVWRIESLVPRRHGQTMYRKPPGVTWAHLTAFQVARQLGAPTDVEHLILYARVASAVAGLLTLAAVFWIGHSIGGAGTAFFAALICAANPVFMYHARLAAMPAHLSAWSVLSIAAALWAIRPLKAPPSIERQFIGWTTSGLAMGVAILVHGPPALLMTLGPILLLLLLCPNRVSHLMGLIAATLIGVLMVMPWALFVQEHDPLAWRQWGLSFLGAAPGADSPLKPNPLGSAGWWLLVVLVSTLPWTLWLLGAAVQPFSTSSAGSRLRLTMGWVWLAPLAGLSLFQAQADRRVQLMPALAAVAVLLAALFQQYTDLTAEGRYVRSWRVLRWPYLVALSLLTLLAPAVMVGQSLLVEYGWMTGPILAAPRPVWLYAVGVMGVLAGIMFLGWRWALNHFPAKALIVWAVWMLVLLPLSAACLGGAATAVSPIRGDAALLADATRDRTLYWLLSDPKHPEPDPALMVYTRRIAPAVSGAQLTDLAASSKDVDLLTRHDQPSPGPGWIEAATFTAAKLKLWRQVALDAHRPR